MTNQEIIEAFYKAFQQQDSKAMNSLLAENVEFNDPAFGKLKGDEVKYMWQFLTENAKDFSLKINNIKSKNQTVTANLEATYTFSTTGNKVINKISSSFEFENGKIINHNDDFDLKNWVKQALGNTAGIFGGSFLVRNVVQKQSKALLQKYISKNELL